MADRMEQRVMFLPGAGGDGDFWKPVGERLPGGWEKHYLRWPGLGNQPHDPAIRSIHDLYTHAAKTLDSPSVIVAQSMGGIIAVMLALQCPRLVTHLVLTATSGGVDVAKLGAKDWRPEFAAAFPKTARWILTEQADLSPHLATLRIPTLLLWGEDDPISPVAVGSFLNQRIPRSRLEVIPGAGHDFAREMPEVVAPLIRSHLETASPPMP